MYGSVAEGGSRGVTSRLWLEGRLRRGGCVYAAGSRGVTSGLWLEGRVRSMLIVMLGGDLDVATRV